MQSPPAGRGGVSAMADHLSPSQERLGHAKSKAQVPLRVVGPGAGGAEGGFLACALLDIRLGASRECLQTLPPQMRCAEL